MAQNLQHVGCLRRQPAVEADVSRAAQYLRCVASRPRTRLETTMRRVLKAVTLEWEPGNQVTTRPSKTRGRRPGLTRRRRGCAPRWRGAAGYSAQLAAPSR